MGRSFRTGRRVGAIFPETKAVSANTLEFRRKTHAVKVAWGGRVVTIGGMNPIVVQSMTNTSTADVESSVAQVLALARAGSELVRLTVNTPDAARGVARIREALDRAGCDVPLVGDFHYNGHKLLADHPECAAALSKYRINPGNVGKGDKGMENFASMIECAKKYGAAVRIGVNWGSLDQALLARMMDENSTSANPLSPDAVLRAALVESAVQSADMAVKLGLPADRIVLSAKVSEVQGLIAVYRMLARRGTYALHLGLTEAGIGSKGIVASTAALSVLLQEGHRRHDPRLAHAVAGCSPHRGSRGCSGDSSVHGTPELHSDGDELPGLAAARRRTCSSASPRARRSTAFSHAGLARDVSGRREHDGRRHGLRRQWPRRKPPGRHRHQSARIRRKSGRTRLCSRREGLRPQGR